MNYELIEEILQEANHSELLAIEQLIEKEIRLSELAILEGFE